MRIILTGLGGRLGRQVAQRLSESHEVTGIDRRPCLGLPANVVHHRIDLRRRAAEEVFRHAKADAVVHVGLVHNLRMSSDQLYADNVVGTETLLHWAHKYAVKKVILLPSGDVYGPHPGNSVFINEDAPLLASQRFPQIRTLVAVDRAMQSFFCRYQDTIDTVVLRPAHIVGANVRNAPSHYLRLRVMPTIMGFDPMLQLISENDVIRALQAALKPGLRGVYNLAGSAPVPLSMILRVLAKPVLPVPHVLFRAGLTRLWRYHLSSFVPPELDHLRFGAVLDTSRITTAMALQFDGNLRRILSPFMLQGIEHSEGGHQGVSF